MDETNAESKPLTNSQLKKRKKKLAKERNEQKRNEQESAKQPRLDQGEGVVEETILLQMLSTHTLKWKCDVCKAKHFDSFEDAVEHEKSCTGHTVDAPASRTTEESLRLQFEEQLAASEAKIVMLEQSLEQTKQSNQSIIDDLESSKEHLVVELATSRAKIVLLEAELASITNEVPSNSTKADDNLARIQTMGGTTAEYKAWRNRQRSKKDNSEVNYESCQYDQMQTECIEIGPHEDETPLQAKIRELNDLSQKHPQRDVRSEEVFTEIYLLVLEIKQLAIENRVRLRWDPFVDYVIVKLENHHLPNICGGNNNGIGGFFNTGQNASGNTVTTDEIERTICVWMPAYCKENGIKCSIGVNCKYYDATPLALMREGKSNVNEGCRLGVTTGYECFQFIIINGKIHMKCDGTEEKNRHDSNIYISRMIISKKWVDGELVDTVKGDQHKVRRHQFAYHCIDSYLETGEVLATRIIPVTWKMPYEKDHADQDNTHQEHGNVRKCHSDDNKLAKNLK